MIAELPVLKVVNLFLCNLEQESSFSFKGWFTKMKIGIEIDNLVFYVHMPLMFVPVRCRNGPKY